MGRNLCQKLLDVQLQPIASLTRKSIIILDELQSFNRGFNTIIHTNNEKKFSLLIIIRASLICHSPCIAATLLSDIPHYSNNAAKFNTPKLLLFLF